jgi:CBS domain-containing protein
MAVRDSDNKGTATRRRRYPETEGEPATPPPSDAGRDERGILERATDEIRSWIGDGEAGRRRRLDEAGYFNGETRFSELKAVDAMTSDVTTVRPGDSIEHAARMMLRCDCGALPVTDPLGRLLGMVTDRDIAVRLVAQGADTKAATVGDCMTSHTFACYAEDPLEACMRQLARHQIRRIPVVDDLDRVIGIISQSDIARIAGSHSGSGERRAVTDVLYAISRPGGGPNR